MKASTQQSQKMAAAISAVLGYIRAQEDAAAMSPAEAEPCAAPSHTAAAPVKMWGISGRQDVMNMRNLMQLRTFQGSKLR